jgi:hypothetical protein
LKVTIFNTIQSTIAIFHLVGFVEMMGLITDRAENDVDMRGSAIAE